MPRGLATLVAERLDSELGQHRVDMRVQVRSWGSPDSQRPEPTAPVLLEVGGCWDVLERRWDGDGAIAATWHQQPAQYHAIEWFAGWLRCYVTRQWPGQRTYVAMFAGGRRAGKSDCAFVCAALFALALPDRIVWLISESEEKTEELRRTMDGLLPEGCYRPEHGGQTYQLWNGSRVRLLSGYQPAMLKKGRVDLWVLNEAQNFPRQAYVTLRSPLADTGGLGIIACNPPDRRIGQWLLDAYAAALAGLDSWKLFRFDWRKNPTLDRGSLEAMLTDPTLTEEDRKRELDGEFIPIGDRVFYAFSTAHNIRPAPAEIDCTAEFCREHLGVEYDVIVSCDFQVHPHMAATIWRVWRDASSGEYLLWIVDEIVIEHGHEHDVIDELVTRSFDPQRTAIIGDASGEWQDAERTKGRGSFDAFRERGFVELFLPDERSKRNPDVIATCRVVNGLLCNQAGVRRIFSVPENVHTNDALDKWENRRGVPFKRSDYAHLSDTVRYVCWRFFPRRQETRTWSYDPVPAGKSGRARELEPI